MTDDDVVINMKAILGEKAQAPVNDGCCIYRVPFAIHKLNEEAYTPKFVSIGPFHHNHPRLQNMERHKLSYCKAFLERTQASSDNLIHYILDLEPKFRGYYSHTLEFSREELVKIIFVDSCFIFELFWKDIHNDQWSSQDKAFIFNPLVAETIVLDLLLLENQLPFFVLENLYNMSFPARSVHPSFFELTFRYFARYMLHCDGIRDLTVDNITHFTDLLRTFYLPHSREKRPCRKEEFVKHLPSATELSEAGVKFKVKTKNSNCLFNFTFSRGVLEMPQLLVEDRTEVVFRNIMVLEQFHYPEESYITDYAFVLDFLINTSKDVDILVQKGVLVNYLGDSDSVANMFNSLCKNILHVNFCSHYFDLCTDLDDFHRNPCNKLKSTLRRDYCQSPWQTAASIAAIILLILSFIQTLCSIWQVVRQ
ncbi:hypothetical protein VNO78_00932 [Psophocarpus tetragonolobus]|uniref:Uncharacterized protein n=1 Tax=Psophocarpus tetragonolobus TaxID=3891 RepID=A0AAN9SZX3_PSOTE